ncbi:MAG: acetyltransferase, ribosomal protein N-acetylase [Ilumatobacteraceae bacterium]|nr:acetyltransferase, ribosomal protein N-acetylase [Ilumatobacteraceae bacterium]
MISSSDGLTLTGNHVQLEPLSLDHVHQLVVAANEDRSTYGWTPVPETAGAMTSYVTNLLADAEAKRIIPFAQRRLSDQRVIGCTRYLEIRYWTGRDLPDEVEIGGTWLAASAQRTPINTEAKLLLMTNAFEAWDVRRLAICTDARNMQSRNAIERVGAKLEGILRKNRASAVAGEIGQPRDTAMHSVLDTEWPDVKARLQARLA